MNYLLFNSSFFNSSLAIYALVFFLLLLRYFGIAGVTYFVVWIWQKERFYKIRIQHKFPAKKEIVAEINNSLVSFIIFGFVGLWIYHGNKSGYYEIYSNLVKYGLVYYIFSIVMIILFHDTWFYWMHRAIHIQPFFRIIHKIHHNSTNPSPFASFSFHPFESVLEALVLPLFLLVFPLHFSTIIIFLFFMTVMNVIGHLGYEFYPSGFTINKFLRWNNTSTHHNMHHKFFNCNYGLYFNFWDRLMGTNHPDYQNTFELIKANKKKL